MEEQRILRIRNYRKSYCETEAEDVLEGPEVMDVDSDGSDEWKTISNSFATMRNKPAKENVFPYFSINNDKAEISQLREAQQTAAAHSNYSSSSRNLKNDLEEGLLKCPFCFQRFFAAKLLIIHLYSHQLKEDPETTLVPADNFPAEIEIPVPIMQKRPRLKKGSIPYQIHKCPYANCDYESDNFTYFRQHLEKSHDPSRPFKCAKCSRTFKSSRFLATHETQKCGRDQTVNGRYPCKICGKLFGRYPLELHMRTHTGERPFECQVCGMRLRQKGYLKLHMKRAHSNRVKTRQKVRYNCPKCEYFSNRMRRIDQHLATLHDESRPVKCTKCSCFFEDSRQLTRHDVRTHQKKKVASASHSHSHHVKRKETEIDSDEEGPINKQAKSLNAPNKDGSGEIGIKRPRFLDSQKRSNKESHEIPFSITGQTTTIKPKLTISIALAGISVPAKASAAVGRPASEPQTERNVSELDPKEMKATNQDAINIQRNQTCPPKKLSKAMALSDDKRWKIFEPQPNADTIIFKCSKCGQYFHRGYLLKLHQAKLSH